MTPRSLFIIILRVFGIISVKQLIDSIPELFSSFLKFSTYFSATGRYLFVIYTVLNIAFCGLISFGLIFKADYLVAKFKLDQNFTEPILQFNISIPSILRIAIIVAGALLLLQEIPTLFRIVFNYIEYQKANYYPTGSVDWSPAIYSGVKIILGLLIIGERNRILEVLMDKKESAEEESQ